MNTPKRLESTFLRSVRWLAVSQLAVRVARLGSTVVVARWLSPEHFGVVAIVLAVNEISHVVARSATASRMVSAKAEELDDICQSAYRLNWLIGVSLFFLQCLISIPLALAYGNSLVIFPLCYLALSYVLLPVAMVQCSLNIRHERMDVVAQSEVAQALLDSVLTIALAILGFGLWALILPKLIVIPIWLVMHRRRCAWRGRLYQKETPVSELLVSTKRVIGVEVLNVFRHNIDYIVIGYFLGLPALGLYFFAYNAGLGISRGFISVLNVALFPHLCSSGGDRGKLLRRFNNGIGLIVLVVSPLVLIQAILAPYYVPVIFGERWVDLGAVPLVVLICFVGIPLALSENFSQFLRAVDQTGKDLIWHFRFSAVFFFTVLVSLNWGLIGVAAGILIIQYISIPVHYAINIRPLTKNRKMPKGIFV